MKAEEKQWTNQELLDRLLTHELNSREHKRLEKHLKLASFPEYLPLEERIEFNSGQREPRCDSMTTGMLAL